MIGIAPAPPGYLPRSGLDRLIAILRDEGRTVIGPIARDGAIVYDEVTSTGDLPAGWTDDQAPGRYRLSQTGSPRLFEFTVGPQGWNRYTQPPRVPTGTSNSTRS